MIDTPQEGERWAEDRNAYVDELQRVQQGRRES
jgi:hypothetical protein